MMKKWIKRITLLLLILLVGLIVTPFFLKGKIIKALKYEANNQLNATIDFSEDIGITFFKQFPKITVTLIETSVIGIGEFIGDTFMYLPKTEFSLNAKSIINGDRANIKGIVLNQPYVNIKVNKDGQANWDIIKPDSTRSDSALELSLGLEDIEVIDGRFNYDDRSIPFSTAADKLNILAKGDLEAENFMLVGTVETPELEMTYNGLNLLHNVNTDVNVQMDMDMKNMKFTFKEGKAKLNNLDLEAEGFVQLNEDDMDFDLKFSSANTAFKNILSLVPAIFAKDFNKVKTQGSMAFEGFMKGKMTDTRYPAFGFKTNVTNGYFKYPQLPEAVSNIFLNLDVSNKDGIPDHTVIHMPKFSATALNENIRANVLIKTPISDPLVDAKVKGKIDLGQLKKFVPLEESEKYQGVVDADLFVNSYMSYIETEQYDKVKTKGFFKGENLVINSSSLQDQLDINQLDLVFTPSEVEINAFKGNYGKSDYDIAGTVKNLIPYIIKDETLTGKLNLSSTYFNTNPFMTEMPVQQVEEPQLQDTVDMVYLDIPGNLDIDFAAEIKSLIYDNLNIEDVSGSLKMADQKIQMQNVKGKLLDGSFVMKEGTYDASHPSNPFSGLDFKLDRVDILKSATYLNFIKKLGPIAKYTNGLFSIDFKMGTELLNDLSPKYPTFNGEGVIKVSNATIKGLKTLNTIGDMLKIEKLKSFNVKDLLIRFKIINGNFALLDSITLPLWKGSELKLTGGSSLTGDIQYFGRIDIPRALFGEANTALNGLLDKTKAKGLNIDVSSMVPVDALIGGSFTNPTVKLDLGSTKKSLIDNVKDQAKKEVVKKVDEGKEIGKAKVEAEKERAKQRALDSIAEVKAKAKVKADAIVAEAEARAAAIKAEARRSAATQKAKLYAQADSIEKRGSNPLEKLATRKTAEKLRLEADKKEQQILVEADKRADAVVQKAREQATKLE